MGRDDDLYAALANAFAASPDLAVAGLAFRAHFSRECEDGAGGTQDAFR